MLGVAMRASSPGGAAAASATTSSMSISSRRMSVQPPQRRQRGSDLQVEDHGPELPDEAAEKREDKGTVVDGVAELGEGYDQCLEVAAEVGDCHRPLFGCAELGGEQQGTQLVLAKKLVLEESLGDTRVWVAQHH